MHCHFMLNFHCEAYLFSVRSAYIEKMQLGLKQCVRQNSVAVFPERKIAPRLSAPGRSLFLRPLCVLHYKTLLPNNFVFRAEKLTLVASLLVTTKLRSKIKCEKKYSGIC